MRLTLRRIAAHSGILVVAFIASCSNEHLVSISVTPSDPSLTAIGQTIQFSASGTTNHSNVPPSDITSQASWSSSTTSIATISAAGLATVVGCGTTTITAEDSNVQGSTTLTSTCTGGTGGSGGNPVLTAITLYPGGPTIPQIGQTTQFLAQGTYTPTTTNDNLTNIATWTSSNTAIATVNSTGLASAVGCGTTTITALYQGIVGTTLLTVSCTSTQNITGVTLYPSTPTIPQTGQTTQFLALSTNSQNSTSTDVTRSSTWASSNAQIATINSTGLATAVSCGTTTITAEYQGFLGQTLLTITCAAPGSITIYPTAPTIPQIGQPTQFLADGIFGGTPTNVTQGSTWASSNNTVATINSTGDATVVGCGTTTITAIYQGVVGTATLDSTCTIGQGQTYSSIDVDPSAPVIPQIGQTTQFLAIGNFEQGGQTDLTNSATWASSNEQVATVTANGTATAVSCGTTTISAESESILGQSLLTISCTPITSVELIVAKTGTTQATITSQPAGINCGVTCSAEYNEGTGILLTAVPPPTSWTNCDQVINNVCSFTLVPDPNVTTKTVTANY